MVNNNFYTKKSNKVLNPLEKYRKKQKEKEKQKMIIRRKQKREQENKEAQNLTQKHSFQQQQQFNSSKQIIAVDLDKLEQQEQQQQANQSLEKQQKKRIRGPPEHPVPFYVLDRIRKTSQSVVKIPVHPAAHNVPKNYKTRRLNYVDYQKNDPFYKLTTDDQYDIRINQSQFIQNQPLQQQQQQQQIVQQQQQQQQIVQQQQQMIQNEQSEKQTNQQQETRQKDDLEIPKNIRSDFQSLFQLKQSIDQEQQYIENKVIIKKKAEIAGKSQLDVSIKNRMFVPSSIMKQKQNKDN